MDHMLAANRAYPLVKVILRDHSVETDGSGPAISMPLSDIKTFYRDLQEIGQLPVRVVQDVGFQNQAPIRRYQRAARRNVPVPGVQE